MVLDNLLWIIKYNPMSMINKVVYLSWIGGDLLGAILSIIIVVNR